MKDIKRRAIALTLALALNLSMAPAVFANDEMPAEEVKQEVAIEQIEKVEEIKIEAPAEELKEEVKEELKEEVKIEEQIEEKAEEKVEAIEEIKEEIKAEEKAEAPAEKKLEEISLEAEKKELPAEMKAIKEELPKAEIVAESTPVIVETAQEEQQIVEEIAEEMVEEEPVFVSDAVKMTVSGGLSKYYLEAPENTTKFTAVNKNASNKNAEDQNITWTSSDESLATVDETGLVTFHATTEGTVKITATPANADIKPVTKNITIKHLTLKDVTYTISTPITVYAGAEQAYSISFTPNYALDVLGIDDLEIYWSVESTDGKSEATISEDGVLNPITPGKIKVKALLNIETGATAAKNITIKEPILVNKLSISPANVTLKIEGEKVPTKTLSASVSPYNATNKNITWTSSDENVATVNSNGVVTAVGEGTAVITAASEGNPDVTATATITVEDLNNKKYTVTVKHYFTKTFACDEMYNGVPSPYEFMVEGETSTVKHGETVDATDYIMDGPQRWPHIFTYNGQKYMMGSSYVAAKGAYGDVFEATSDIDIIFTYSAIAPYTLTINYLNADTNEAIADAYNWKYECQQGYIEMPYNVASFLAKKQTAFEGYEFVRAEGDIEKPWSEESKDNTINMYFSEIKPVEEPIVEEPVIEEPAVEEPVIEEPVVEEPEIIEDEEVPEAAPVVEEVEIEETSRPRHKSEKAEPVAETSTEETKIEEAEEIEEIAEDLEEEIADEEAPLASFEVAEAETTETAEVLVNSPLTGDNRNTGAWAGLSLASLLGILYLSRKRKVTE
ncbi:MAG: Ig-like domain-containing protein [Firmicutes bacterium]|nr:Ig-like domain-containing protein [Bacillota bacterium]